jgi:hypothetical protein
LKGGRWNQPQRIGALSRIAVIGSAKMLRFIANVRFGEAVPQRRNRLRMSGIWPFVTLI